MQYKKCFLVKKVAHPFGLPDMVLGFSLEIFSNTHPRHRTPTNPPVSNSDLSFFSPVAAAVGVVAARAEVAFPCLLHRFHRHEILPPFVDLRRHVRPQLSPVRLDGELPVRNYHLWKRVWTLFLQLLSKILVERCGPEEETNEQNVVREIVRLFNPVWKLDGAKDERSAVLDDQGCHPLAFDFDLPSRNGKFQLLCCFSSKRAFGETPRALCVSLFLLLECFQDATNNIAIGDGHLEAGKKITRKSLSLPQETAPQKLIDDTSPPLTSLTSPSQKEFFSVSERESFGGYERQR